MAFVVINPGQSVAAARAFCRHCLTTILWIRGVPEIQVVIIGQADAVLEQLLVTRFAKMILLARLHNAREELCHSTRAIANEPDSLAG